MSEYTEVEKPFLEELRTLGWNIIDQGPDIPQKIGISPGKITARDTGYRRASFGKNNALQFHWKIMMAPLKVVDYIIVHELCHFHHKNHTEAFWNEVDKIIPNYPERKEWLKKNGAGLDI